MSPSAGRPARAISGRSAIEVSSGDALQTLRASGSDPSPPSWSWYRGPLAASQRACILAPVTHPQAARTMHSHPSCARDLVSVPIPCRYHSPFSWRTLRTISSLPCAGRTKQRVAVGYADRMSWTVGGSCKNRHGYSGVYAIRCYPVEVLRTCHFEEVHCLLCEETRI